MAKEYIYVFPTVLTTEANYSLSSVNWLISVTGTECVYCDATK
jgi:hypothetical protein